MNYNPIKASDLFMDDGAIDKLIEKINLLDMTMTNIDKQKAKVQAQAKKQEQAYSRLSATHVEHQHILEDEAASAQALVKTNKALERARVKAAVAQSKAVKELTRLKEQQKEVNKIARLEAKLNANKEGSYNALSAQYALNQIELKKLTEEERLNTEQGQKLVQETKEINDALKAMDKQVGVTGRNVGNYKDDIKAALGEQQKIFQELKKSREEFEKLPPSIQKNEKVAAQYREEQDRLNKELVEFGEVTGQTAKDLEGTNKVMEASNASLQDMPGAAGRAGGGLKGLNRTLKVLLRNPITAFIAAIVGGLAALGAAFTRSEKGADLLAKATGFFNGVMSEVVGLSAQVAEGIQAAFEDPQEFVKQLGEGIKNQVINRFHAMLDLAGVVGTALKGIFTLDTETLKRAARDGAQAMIQLGTGMDKEQQEKYTEAIKETSEAIAQKTITFVNLEAQKRAVAKQNRGLAKSIQDYTTEEEKYKAIADDITRSLEEREEASEKSRKAAEERTRLEVERAKNTFGLINTEIRLREANGENVEAYRDQQLAAYEALRQAERDQILTLQENSRQRREIQSDLWEQELDFLIDGFDNQKTINERRIADEELTIEQRRKILNETRKLQEDSFNEQIEVIQRFTKEKIDADKLVAESDAVVLNQQVRALGLSEIAAKRLLEIIRDRRLASQDLADAESDLLESTLALAGEESQTFDQREERLKQYVALVEEEYEKAIVAAQGTEDEQARIAVAEQKRTARLKKAKEQQDELRGDIAASRKEDLDELLNYYSQEEQIQVNNAEASITNERDKQLAILKIRADFLKKRIAALEAEGTKEALAQARILKSQLGIIEKEINAAGREEKSIYDYLGFDLTGGQEEALNNVFDNAKQQFLDFFAFRREIADRNAQIAQSEVAESQRALDQEIANRNAGFAHEVDTAKKRLAEAKKNQREALEQQRQAQNTQRRLAAIQQATNLVTASSKVLKEFGPLAGIPILALLWGTFIASQARAEKLAKKTFGKGTFIKVKGGSHASGNDTPLGVEVDGMPAYVERDEGVAVIRKERMPQAGGFMEKLTNNINEGKIGAKEIEAMSDVIIGKPATREKSEAPKVGGFMRALVSRIDKREVGMNEIAVMNEAISGKVAINVNMHNSERLELVPGPAPTDTSRMESQLGALVEQGSKVYDASGRLVKEGNTRYVYK